MPWWLIKAWLRGYRIVDQGTELDEAMAFKLAQQTATLKMRNRSVMIRVTGKSWVVLVKGYDKHMEDG